MEEFIATCAIEHEDFIVVTAFPVANIISFTTREFFNDIETVVDLTREDALRLMTWLDLAVSVMDEANGIPETAGDYPLDFDSEC